VPSLRVTTREKRLAVFHLWLSAIFECGPDFFKRQNRAGFDFDFEFEFKKASAVFKMSPASRWRDNIFTVGSNPQPGSPSGLTFYGYRCGT